MLILNACDVLRPPSQDAVENHESQSMQNVAELSGSELIHIALGERSYDIVIGPGRLRSIAGTVEPWLTQRFGASPRRSWQPS